MVVPSPRISERVPFGTGRAILDASKNKDLMLTYDFQIISYTEREWFDMIKNKIYHYLDFPELIKEFLPLKEWEFPNYQIFLNNTSNKINIKECFTRSLMLSGF